VHLIAAMPAVNEVGKCFDCGKHESKKSTNDQKKETNKMNAEQNFNDTGEALAIIPEAPIRFGRPERQGPRENEDRAAWKADLEERKARTADQLAKRIEKPELTAEYFKAQIEELTANLENTVETYQASEGTVNYDLVNARERVAKLTAELEEAKRVLASEEQKGTLLDRFRAGVNMIESTLTGIVGRFSEFVANRIIVDRLGRVVPPERLSESLKSEIRQHVRIHDLLQFYPARSAGVRDNDGAESLINRANIAFAKLQAFKQHIEQEA
jgi:hypothetical protein